MKCYNVEQREEENKRIPLPDEVKDDPLQCVIIGRRKFINLLVYSPYSLRFLWQLWGWTNKEINKFDQLARVNIHIKHFNDFTFRIKEADI